MSKRNPSNPNLSKAKPTLTKLGYDAIKESPRRGRISVSTKSEDRELTVSGRQILSSGGRDLLRNLALAGFAIRRHTQTIAKCDFQCSIPNEPEYNNLVKRWMYKWSDRRHCDIAGRHSLKELLILIETHRVIDGDVGILKCYNGMLQIIEGDRIRNPMQLGASSLRHSDDADWIHGVKVNHAGKALRYAIHKRKEGGGFEFERDIPAEWLILCGYFTRIDQIRGVSLLAPAVNQFKDVYESVDYALAKAKLSQLLGFKTMREGHNLDADDTGELTEAIKEKFGVGAVHFDLEKGEEAFMIESSTPSTQFQDFLENVIRIAFSALDLPLEFLMPNIANYYSNRGAFDHYIESCRVKQEALIESLNEITDWRLRIAIERGELPPPPKGMEMDELLWWCDWEGARLPFWRMLEDAKDSLVAYQCGILSPQKTTRQYGIDFAENITELAEALTLAQKHGVELSFEQPVTASNIGV